MRRLSVEWKLLVRKANSKLNKLKADVVASDWKGKILGYVDDIKRNFAIRFGNH